MKISLPCHPNVLVPNKTAISNKGKTATKLIIKLITSQILRLMNKKMS